MSACAVSCEAACEAMCEVFVFVCVCACAHVFVLQNTHSKGASSHLTNVQLKETKEEGKPAV